MTPADKLLGTLVAVIMAMVLPGWVAGLVYGWRSKSWPSVTGEVLFSDLELSNTLRGGRMYRPVVHYTYTVGDHGYKGKRLFFGFDSFYTKRGARLIIEQYTGGQAVAVFYDRSRPASSVLRPGVTCRTWFGIALLGFVIVGIGFGILFSSQ